MVDVVGILTDQPTERGASNYWAKLKQRLKEEGAHELLTNCQQLKLKSPKDGKRYKTDSADASREIAKRGGKYAGDTRKAIEADTGKPVITSQNAAQLNTALPDLIIDIIDNPDKE